MSKEKSITLLDKAKSVTTKRGSKTDQNLDEFLDVAIALAKREINGTQAFAVFGGNRRGVTGTAGFILFRACRAGLLYRHKKRIK